MAQTRLRIAKQLQTSTTPGSIMISDATLGEAKWLAPPVGNKILFFDDTTSNEATWLNIGTNLSIDTGTNTLNASAGAGGYATVQEEGSGLTARTTINFVGSGITASDDSGNSRTNVTLDATLNALASYNTNGLLTQTSADTFTGRSIVGTTNRISVSNGDGVAGNPTIDIHSSYVGQSSITTLGTISTGVWNGTAVTGQYGGTGQTTTAVGDLLVGAASNTWSKLAIGSSNTFLKSNGTTASWSSIAAADLSDGANIAHINANETISADWTFSNNIVSNATPTLSTHVITKGYVDGLISGIKKGSVRAATTTSGTLATSFENGDVIDGVTLATGDLILIKNQSSAQENGVYTVNASGAPTRATWMDAANEVDGTMVLIEDGTTLAGTVWYTVSEVTTLNTDPITFTQLNFSAAIDGSGASNRIAYWADADTLTSSSTFTYNGSVATLGTGTAASSTIFTTQGTGTGSSTYGITHNNSSGTAVFRVADNGELTVGNTNPLSVQSTGISRAGAQVIVQSTGGNVTMTSTAGTVTINSNSAAATSTALDSAAGGTTVNNNATTSHATLTVGNTTKTSTSSNQSHLKVSGGFTVSTSGTNTYHAAEINSTINQTTHTGITRGLYINPTITNAADFRALEINAPSSHYSLWSTGGKVRFDLGSDANYDLYYRGTGGNLVRLPNGTTGQYLAATTSSAPSWQTVSTGVTIGYIEGSTATTIDLDANVGNVKDRDGTNIAFTLPSNLDTLEVYRNGVRLARTGTGTTRDYSLNAGTHEITFTVALAADETVLVVKPS